jgi:Holliday junction resolvasome RuvABC endonuclease subunit
MDGILPLNKDRGMTSNDAVFKCRRLFRTRKVGHSGTLDPNVDGVLPICIGHATKVVSYLMESGKVYTGEVTLGFSTETEDLDGKIVEEYFLTKPFSDELIKENDIGAVFIEDIQLRVNVQSFKKLAQLQGVLVNLFEKNEYLYSFVAPTQWQNYCKARGRSTKEIKEKIKTLEAAGKKESKILSIQFVKDKFKVDTDNDNLSDAICIGHYAVNHFEIEGEALHVKEKE